MSVLKSYFNESVNQNTTVNDDYLLVHKTGKDGEDILVPEKVDYKKISKELGSVQNWSLETLTKLGIDPRRLTPHTSLVGGLEGYNSMEEILVNIDKIQQSKTNTNNNTK